MKIALIGYGKIGHLIEEAAEAKGHQIVMRVDSRNAEKLLNSEEFSLVDVCIDFSTPDAVVNTVKTIAPLGKPIVVGTTGWYDSLDEVRSIVEETGIGLLYAPNFSVGVVLFMKIIARTAVLMNHFVEYDVAGLEIHHNEKVDAPSGTAEAIAKILLERISQKSSVVYDLLDREIASSELHIASLRCGYDPGTHTIFFDGPTDTITLTHKARNRMGFALGALTAASWIRCRKGFFSLEDMLATTHADLLKS